MFDIEPAQALRDFVLPALDVMTEPGEITSVRADQNDAGEIFVFVVFAGEMLPGSYVWSPHVEPGDTFFGLGKFASDLQDHIAECRATWGTLRTYPVAWDEIPYIPQTD